jgi:predicted nucleic acid-binding protein
VKTVFADTGYWIALLHPRDELHTRAKEVSASLGRVQLSTSEMVLTEMLNSFAPRGMYLRQAASTIIEQLYKDANTTVVPQTSILFKQAQALYAQRLDKAWSHTDCSSFCIMQQAGITEALAYDKHFEQAGFKALLRN